MARRYGQEEFFTDFFRGIQGSTRVILFSMLIGLLIALVWWGVFAPKDWFYYLNHYLVAEIVCHLPAACSPNADYTRSGLRPFIASSLVGLFWACTRVFALVSFASLIGLRYYFVRRTQKASESHYLRGAKLLRPSELKAEIDKYKQLAQTPLDLWLGREQIRLPAQMTYRHISMAGLSGTGKTQVISSILEQIASMRRQKGLIVDLNGQYFSRFGKPQDKIISLYDQRSEPWSFWRESVPPEFFAEALVEVDSSGNSKFFSSAGRALMTDLISINSDVQGLWSDLTTNPAKLLPKLDGGISPGLLGAPEQAAGVIASATLEMNFLRHLNYWNPRQDFFSITEWALSQSEDWVFLIVKDRDLSATKPLLRLWFDLAVGGVLQREENTKYPHLWLVCDELPGLGVLPSLGKLLSQGRKYKSSVIAGYQVRGQLDHLYGKDGAKEIYGGLQNKLVFRSPDPDSKEEAGTLGEQDVEEITSSSQIGTGAAGDRSTLNRSIKTRPVVLPSELQNLPDLHAYVKLCEFNPTRIRFDYRAYPEINQASRCEIPPQKPRPSQPPHSEKTSKPNDDDNWESEPAELVDLSDPATHNVEPEPELGYDYDLEEENPNDFLNFGK